MYINIYLIMQNQKKEENNIINYENTMKLHYEVA